MKNRVYLVIIIICTFMIGQITLKLFSNSLDEKRDYVPDKNTAIKIAEAIWFPIYGKSIYNKKPFKAKLLKNGIWQVKGNLHSIQNDKSYRSQKGGVPYIKIRKDDCKILDVYHTK
ncbi:YbbC/YhhH family protein [Bacteroidota bacterium]